jgi:hypothetical protein
VVKWKALKTIETEKELDELLAAAMKERASLEPEETKRIGDLTYGEDVRGDFAYFIESKHFRHGDWRVDHETRTRSQEPVFFRVLQDGVQTSSHGWLEDCVVVQWG